MNAGDVKLLYYQKDGARIELNVLSLRRAEMPRFVTVNTVSGEGLCLHDSSIWILTKTGETMCLCNVKY